MDELKNTIINTYLDSQRVILDKLRSREFWSICNTDEMGEILFFYQPTEFSCEYNWGVINLSKFIDWTSLFEETLFLIPRPPAFRANQLQEGSYPKPLFGYQPNSIERYEWTLEFAKIIDSWLIAATIYDASPLSKNDRFDVIRKVNENPTLFELCSALHFSADSKINWEESSQILLENQKIKYSNNTELFIRVNQIEISNIFDSYTQWHETIIKAIRSRDVWNYCNVYERGNYLFFAISLYDPTSWILIDLGENFDNEIIEVLPGLIQIPSPPAHKLNDFPNINYQPTVQERYEWTLELARRLDAWLAAIISYAFITCTQEDRLKTFTVINPIDTLVNKCKYWLCPENECILDWQS